MAPPSVNTAIARRLVERGVRDAALGYLWDPLAVEICRSAGVGARLELRIVGKAGPLMQYPWHPAGPLFTFADRYKRA